MLAFITVRFIDIIDILIVAYLMYQLYLWMRGTVAMQIFIAIIAIYFLWMIVDVWLNMELLGSILGQIIGLGVLAIIIIFQQEIRRFLVDVSTRYIGNRWFSLERLLTGHEEYVPQLRINSIIKACAAMSEELTGALILIKRKSNLDSYINTGDIISSDTTSRMLRSIFSKTSPLHDGAVIIIESKIHAARCVLPVSKNENLPPHYGMRHRAAIGVSEETDAIVVIVSEETGRISVVKGGQIIENIGTDGLRELLIKDFNLIA